MQERLEEGQRVRIQNLKGKTELNDRPGTVTKYFVAKGRYAVRLDGSTGEEPVLVRPENLARVPDEPAQGHPERDETGAFAPMPAEASVNKMAIASYVSRNSLGLSADAKRFYAVEMKQGGASLGEHWCCKTAR